MTGDKESGRRARILVIDDEPHLLRATSRLLAGAGHQIAEAATGREGLQLTREIEPDLVLLDVMLSDIDGFQVCQRIKADTDLASTFVVLLSGKKTDSDDQALGLEGGADDYIVRPVSNRELLARVEAALRLQRAERMRRSQLRELRERIKELNCLYGISKLIEQAELSLPGVLQGTVELLPPAWKYPEIACARIVLDGRAFQTGGFRETAWKQSRDILVHGGVAGRIEVYYLEERPDEDEGPFLEEERSLLNAIAERLGRTVERIRAEEALHYQATLLKGVSDAVITTDLDFVIQSWNNAAEALYGWPAEQVIGQLMGDVVPTEYVDNQAGAVLARFQAEGAWQGEVVQRHKDGSDLYVLASVTLVRDDAGQPVSIIAVNHDITERKQVEEALQRERDLVAQVMDTSPVGIAVFDRQGRLTFASKLLQQLASLIGATTLIGRAYNDPAWQSIDPDGEPLPDEALPFARVMDSGAPVHNFEHGVRLPDGPRLFLSSSAAPILDESDQVDSVVVTTEDVTQRKLAEAQLEEAAATAERERLARDLHDAVTQSLFSVAAIAEAMPRVWERDPQEARRGLEELRWLTQGALAEMRAMLLELRPAALLEHKLGVLLRQLTDAMMGRTRMSVTTTVVGDCDLPADVQIALYRIAQEALNNIAKHARAKQAKLSLHCEPGRVRLRISDDGRGFDPDTALAHYLGLEIMRERAEAIGAALRIESQPGYGTRIKVEWHET